MWREYSCCILFKQYLKDRKKQCEARSQLLHENYCSAISSLREEDYPVKTLLKTKKCGDRNGNGDGDGDGI